MPVRHMGNKKGSATLVALIVIFVMATLASALYLKLTNRMKLLRQREHSLAAFNLAESAISVGLSGLAQAPESYRGQEETRLGTGTFAVSCKRTETGNRTWELTGTGSAGSEGSAARNRAVRVTVKLEKMTGEQVAGPSWRPVIISWQEIDAR